MVAAQLGTEELYHVSKDEGGVLELAYPLVTIAEPTSAADWRLHLWSAQMARMVGQETIENDPIDEGAAYLARLRPRLVTLMQENKLPALERVESGRVLAHLSDPSRELLQSSQMAFCWVPSGRFTMGAKEDEPGDEIMKKLLVFVAVASVLGCASRPESIPASFVSHEKFIDLDCPTLATKMTESKAELARVSELQDEKATGDAVGVFLVLIPFSKLTGDYAAEVARLKGQIEAIDTAQVKNKCKQVGANESSPSPVKSSPAAAAPSGAASGPEMRN